MFGTPSLISSTISQPNQAHALHRPEESEKGRGCGIKKLFLICGGKRICLPQGLDNALTYDVVRQAAEGLGTYDVRYAFLHRPEESEKGRGCGIKKLFLICGGNLQ